MGIHFYLEAFIQEQTNVLSTPTNCYYCENMQSLKQVTNKHVTAPCQFSMEDNKCHGNSNKTINKQTKLQSNTVF